MRSKGKRIRRKRYRRAARLARRPERIRKFVAMVAPHMVPSLLESAFTDALFPRMLYRGPAAV